MAEEEIQYRIEIQDAQGFEGTEDEVMVVLDLNGQDLPESVAQTILQLAQSSRESQGRRIEPFSQMLVTEAHNEEHGENFIEYVTQQPREEISAITDPISAVSETNMVADVKLEDIDSMIFSTQETQILRIDQNGSPPRILVKNLAELEQLRARNPQVIAPYPIDASAKIVAKNVEEPVKTGHISRFYTKMEEASTAHDTKVEIGVQCEILHSPESKNFYVANDKVNLMNSEGGIPKSMKTEPLWADENVATASKPAEPEETASVPLTPVPPPVEKTCPHCSFTSFDDLDYGRHLKEVHKEKKPFCCSVCSATFEIELSFQIHLIMHASKPVAKRKYASQKFTCPLCSVAYTTRRKLGLHTKDKHDISIFFCSKCKFTCLTEKELSEHEQSKCRKGKRNRVSICPVCKVACLRLTAHLATNHPEHRPYMCDQCGHKSKTVYAMKAHEQTHAESKDFICPTCKRACKSKISLKRHIQNHNPNKKFHCSQCNFSTNDSYEHKRHAIRVHTRKSYYCCKFCNLSFLNHCDLKLHAMSEHQSRDNFYCKYRHCTFSCEARIDFKRHVQIHTGKHRYLCEVCDFTTPFKAHLERHLAVHNNIRPFKCEVCGYECREKINLKKHMVIHSEAKPFQCPQCTYTCKLKNLLDSHIRIMHTSLKPYSCTKCQYSTKTASNLRKHMWIHDEYRPFACRFCPYTAREKNKLRRHEKLKHKDGANPDPMQEGMNPIKEELLDQIPDELPGCKIIFTTKHI